MGFDINAAANHAAPHAGAGGHAILHPADLQHLANFPNLQPLDLGHNEGQLDQINDAALAALANLWAHQTEPH